MLRDRAHNNKWYCQPLKTKINSLPINHRQGVGVVGFRAAFMTVILDARNTEGRGELALFVWDRHQVPTEVTSRNIADTTFETDSC